MVPDALRRNVTGAWGERGERWLHDLPRLLLDVCREWDLEPGPPYELSYHWVCPVTRPGGSPAVLKLGLPGAVHLRREAAVLSAWDGAGAVRLLAHSDLLGALLMERATPGTLCRDLVPVDDEAATAALLDVGWRLHRPVPADLDVPDIAGYAGDLDAYLATWPDAGPLPRDLVTAAAGTLAELLTDAPDPVLLHGDLHHDNVLRSNREPCLAIDPHGVVGEPAAEVDLDRRGRRTGAHPGLRGGPAARTAGQVRARDRTVWSITHFPFVRCWSLHPETVVSAP